MRGRRVLGSEGFVETLAGPHAVTSVGGTNYTYDLNRNRLTKTDATGSQTITWNVENLL